jgi:adenine deaminase
LTNIELLSRARGEEKAELVLKNAIILDVFNEELFEDDIAIVDGRILGIGNYEGEEEIDLKGKYVVPGFIDGHLHLESAMVRVEEFARRVIPLGVTTIFADPHEIANVAGLDGIKYLLDSGRNLPWNFNIMLPSCVPATGFETSGAVLRAEDLSKLIDEEGVYGLGEVMDYPGVIYGNEIIWDKIRLFKDRFKDGHAPGLSGKELNAYLLAGIRADHECTRAEEALEKIRKGMYIMVREGSVTRDLLSLLPAINDKNENRFLFATDDRHPDDLIEEGSINFLVKKAIDNGLNPLRAIKLASFNSAQAMGFEYTGAIAPNYRADILVIDNLKKLNIEMVFKDGVLVAKDGKALFDIPDRDNILNSDNLRDKIFNSVKIAPVDERDFKLPEGRKFRVIELIEDQIISKEKIIDFGRNGISNKGLIKNDILKIAVVERHHRSGNIGLGLLKGFGLKEGAIASSVAHDSHNIIIVGLEERDMYLAVKEIERLQGGIVIVKSGKVLGSLALPIAGLISDRPLPELAERLIDLRNKAFSMGVMRKAPFMTLSFMALPVIPELKITDMGLFNVNEFKHVSLKIE